MKYTLPWTNSMIIILLLHLQTCTRDIWISFPCSCKRVHTCHTGIYTISVHPCQGSPAHRLNTCNSTSHTSILHNQKNIVLLLIWFHHAMSEQKLSPERSVTLMELNERRQCRWFREKGIWDPQYITPWWIMTWKKWILPAQLMILKRIWKFVKSTVEIVRHTGLTSSQNCPLMHSSAHGEYHRFHRR